MWPQETCYCCFPHCCRGCICGSLMDVSSFGLKVRTWLLPCDPAGPVHHGGHTLRQKARGVLGDETFSLTQSQDVMLQERWAVAGRPPLPAAAPSLLPPPRTPVHRWPPLHETGEITWFETAKRKTWWCKAPLGQRNIDVKGVPEGKEGKKMTENLLQEKVTDESP